MQNTLSHTIKIIACTKTRFKAMDKSIRGIISRKMLQQSRMYFSFSQQFSRKVDRDVANRVFYLPSALFSPNVYKQMWYLLNLVYVKADDIFICFRCKFNVNKRINYAFRGVIWFQTLSSAKSVGMKHCKTKLTY